ncbi:asparagine synthase-related protein [uncultured Chloroflexus sp.]|uniref:asparagine synthetase B family protein n=1 Tax=uncultured Chloroflexus sp. TaxID=214040 RepID=UPI0026176454|nr:asparagine synthase-related protein [uncultured Chloroflexus sp.]
MSRFLALINDPDYHATKRRLAAADCVEKAGCFLVSIPDTRPWLSAGPYRYYGRDQLDGVGEVTLFNRAELVTRLADARSATLNDGELLLALIDRCGLGALADVEGMFALAVWDGRHLTLIRDPVGARTLFYAKVGLAWAAASTLHVLRHWPALRPRLNLAAVQSFLTFAYLPGTETLLAGVHEVLPGQYIRLAPDGSWSSGFYWTPHEAIISAPPSVHAQHLRHTLENVTLAMLPRHEPVGVLLSGGVDSSLVTALAARLHDAPVQTYSISFGDKLPNELAYSQLVATHCRTRHQVLNVSGRQIADHLLETVAALDCPVGDPLTTPNLLLARAAARDGLRVILNGEGGDPCFGGPKNIPMLAAEWQQPDLSPQQRAHLYLRSYRKCYDELPRLLHPDVQAALSSAPPLTERVIHYLHAPTMTSYLNRLLLTNVRTKGAHHILTKVERITAASGLEGRAPLFSRAIVAQSFTIPPELKLAGTREKWILKQAVADLLPAQIIERPKSGMRVPVQHWLRGPLRDLAADTLLSPRARARGLFQTKTIQAWMDGKGMVWPRQGIALWMLVTLELWLRAFVDGE